MVTNSVCEAAYSKVPGLLYSSIAGGKFCTGNPKQLKAACPGDAGAFNALYKWSDMLRDVLDKSLVLSPHLAEPLAGGTLLYLSSRGGCRILACVAKYIANGIKYLDACATQVPALA